MAARVEEEDADLGVLDAPGRPAVLALDADGVRALLEEAGLVEDQDGLFVTEVLDDVAPEVIADGLGVPIGRIEEALDAVGGGLAEEFCEVPAVLPLGRGEEAAEVAEGTAAGLGASEAGGDARVEGVEFVPPPFNGFGHSRLGGSGSKATMQVRL